MGSCFKFTMCRKRAYDFQNTPYEPTVQAAEGRYRVSTADVEGWDPDVSLKVNGDAGEEKHQPQQQPQAVVETSVVASPSNSDVTFGETFKDANENNQEEDVKDKKKKEKGKKEKNKEKSKKEKSKKEKSKKEKSKKNKDKEENENTVNENVEKDQRIENDEDIETKKDGDETGDNVDISNMETLPREERHVVTQSEQTTTESKQVISVTTQEIITESSEHAKAAEDNHDTVSDSVPMEDSHVMEDGEGEGEKVHVEIREPLADDKSIHSEDDQEKHTHVRTTLVVSNSHIDGTHDRKSSLSDSEMERLDDVEDKGEDRHSIEGGAYPYPEPEEQIDVRNIRNLTDGMSLVTEDSSMRIEEAEDGSAVTTVTKVIVTETVEVKATTDDHAD